MVALNMNLGMAPTIYNVISKVSGSNVSVDQFFANVEETVIHSGVRRESEHREGQNVAQLRNSKFG